MSAWRWPAAMTIDIVSVISVRLESQRASGRAGRDPVSAIAGGVAISRSRAASISRPSTAPLRLHPGILGGLNGRALQAGDRLPRVRARINAERFGCVTVHGGGPIRAVLGPSGTSSQIRVSRRSSARTMPPREADRMGMRLEGPALEHARGFNIVSDGIVTGATGPRQRHADRAPCRPPNHRRMPKWNRRFRRHSQNGPSEARRYHPVRGY